MDMRVSRELFSSFFSSSFLAVLRKTSDGAADNRKKKKRLQNSMFVACFFLPFFCLLPIHKHKNVEYNTRLMAKIYKFVRSVPHSSALVLGVRPTE